MMLSPTHNEGRGIPRFQRFGLLVQGVTAMRYKRLLMLGFLLGLPAVSQGAVVTFGFEGDVANIHDPVGVLDFVHSGQRFVYTFSFDTDTPNVYPEPNPNAGSFVGISSSLTVGGLPFTVGVPVIGTADMPGSDEFGVGSPIQWDQPGFLASGHGVSVNLLYGNVFDSPALPQVPYDLTLFTSKSFGVQFWVPGGSTGEIVGFSGPVDSMYLVPEPATGIGLALASLIILRKRRGS